ncbi:MAG: 2-C-methyl-D-erythritol 2,4-cyclodiphosphate synthase [Oscillospiraceae bacterium]|nr:2-C-methyl-D-erythritol 2,4-cyclodiphosphate synthase [Oscillospiraceae bacterium]
MTNIRIGHGYDVHRLTEGRKLIIGGVEIPHRLGLLGHSDADVLTHAVMDAMLGALALGDIGKHFPDTDPQYAGADSIQLLAHVRKIIQEQGWTLGNLDATILAQAPKLAPHIPEMRRRISETLGCDPDQVSIKATTEEKLGFTGQEQGIAAHCVVLLVKGSKSE